MKKLIIVFFFAFYSVSCLYAGWPINRTPRIEGVITDTTTGEPIENVVVSARWLKNTPALGDTVRKYCGSHIAITDKEGRYKIPAKISIHLLSSFNSLSINMHHPLYEHSIWNTVMKLERYDLRKEHKQHVGKYGIRRSTGGVNASRYSYNLWVEDRGVIRYDVKLMSLEEKWVKAIKRLGLKKGERPQNPKLEDPVYELNVKFLTIAQTGIVNFKYNDEYLYDEKKIFTEWEKIADLIGRTKDLDRAKNWILKRRQ